MKTWLALPLIILIAGCNSNPVSSEKSVETPTAVPTEESSQEQESDTTTGELQNPGDTTNSPEVGKATLIKIVRPDQTIETGPIKMTFKTISAVELEPSDQFKPIIQKEGIVTMLGVSVIAENTSEDTISFHPNQAQIVAGKEQARANLLLSEEVGGEFIGKIEKKGKIIFILDTPAEEIETVKIVIDPPNNENFQSVGDKVTLEHEF